MTGQPTRVALVEDHLLLAQSLSVALGAEGFDPVIVRIPPEVTHASALLDSVLDTGSAVTLLDLDLGHAGEALPLIAPLAGAGVCVCVVTAAADPTRWGECLANGAREVVQKACSLEEIVATVRHAVSGRQVITETRRYELIQRWYRHQSDIKSAHARLDSLSPREAQVLIALAEGRRVREIAAEAFVSQATVRSQVKSILAKLGVSSQIAAVAMVNALDWSGAS